MTLNTEQKTHNMPVAQFKPNSISPKITVWTSSILLSFSYFRQNCGYSFWRDIQNFDVVQIRKQTRTVQSQILFLQCEIPPQNRPSHPKLNPSHYLGIFPPSKSPFPVTNIPIKPTLFQHTNPLLSYSYTLPSQPRKSLNVFGNAWWPFNTSLVDSC